MNKEIIKPNKAKVKGFIRTSVATGAGILLGTQVDNGTIGAEDLETIVGGFMLLLSYAFSWFAKEKK